MSTVKHRRVNTKRTKQSIEDKRKGNILIGARIRNIRLELDMSQENFADLIGISPSYLSAIERGVRKVSARICAAINQATGLSCDYILTGRSDEFHYNYDHGNSSVVPLINERGSYQKTPPFDLSPAKRRLLLLFNTCTDTEAVLCYNVCHSMLSGIRNNTPRNSFRSSSAEQADRDPD